MVCRSAGSRPPAIITWYLDGRRIEGGSEEVRRRQPDIKPGRFQMDTKLQERVALLLKLPS